MLPRETPPPGAAARRTVLLAGLSAAALTGCDLDPRSTASPTDTPTSGAPAAPSEDADLAILDRVRAETERTLQQVRRTARRHPRLRAPLRPIAAIHRAHLRELDAAGRASTGSGTAPLPTPGDAARALRAVRVGEQSLADSLVGSAVAAGSGSFARLLAGMSAAVAQQISSLPEGP